MTPVTSTDAVPDRGHLIREHFKTVSRKYLALYDDSVNRCSELIDLFQDVQQKEILSDNDCALLDQLKKLKEETFSARMTLETDIERVIGPEYSNFDKEAQHACIALGIQLIETFVSTAYVPLDAQIQEGIQRLQSIARAHLC